MVFRRCSRCRSCTLCLFPVSTLKCTLIGHVGFQPLTTDSRSNPTPEGFEPLTKSSRSNSLTNCTLWQQYAGNLAKIKSCKRHMDAWDMSDPFVIPTLIDPDALSVEDC
jgi:hypothetical protein